MQLQLQDFTLLVRNQAAAVTASCRTLMDLSVGSVLRAVLEANASVALWMQWLIMEVLSTTRAATSKGADLDSWMADFGLTRLPAVAATGSARFSRATAGLAAVVPVGAVIRTGATATDQAFTVTSDASRADWNGTGYVVAAASLDTVLPIQAVVPGRAGNVQAESLRLLSTAIPGIDTVSNYAAATGGLDAETDGALRVRFAGFLDSRTRATVQAVDFAIRSVQQGLQFVILDRTDTAGATRAGYFTVVLDDGSGAPPDSLLQQVGVAIEAVRPVGSSYGVVRPNLVRMDVSMQVQAPTAAVALVRAAISAFIAQLPIGAGLVVSRLIQVAHDASPDVARVGNVTINGLSTDYGVTMLSRAVPGTVTVLS